MPILGHQELSQGELAADVVIVGSGAAGASSAYALAGAGAKVVVLEEGFLWDPDDLVPKPTAAYANLYQEAGGRTMRGPVMIPLPGGKAVGGSTLVNSAICFRAPEPVLARWRAEHGIAWASRAELDPIYDELEKYLEIAPTDPSIARKNNLVVKRGVEKLAPAEKWEHGFIRRNAPGCVGCGVCQLGCPTGGKASVDRNFIPDAVTKGMTLVHGCKVEEIVVAGGRAAGVTGTVRARGGSLAVKRLSVKAGKVILAGSAIGTPLMLLRQSLANSSGQVGRNLHVHPGVGTVGLFDEVVDLWDGVTQGYYADLDDGLLLETFTATPEVFFAAIPLGALPIGRYKNLAACGAMIGDEGQGRVKPGLGGRADITYAPAERDRTRLLRGLRTIARVLFAAGAREVHPGVAGTTFTAGEEAALAQLGDGVALDRLVMQASHPQGTARMGADPERHVVRLDGRTHDVPGLYVFDGSLFPTALGVNPQVTIMAFATRLAREMAKQG